MDRSRNYVVFGVLALVVSLVAVSLAYAGFTQSLTINGTATVKAASWDVHFTNVANKNVTGTAEWGVQPALNGATTIGDYSVTFKTPGDSASFTFDVENSGSFNAKWTGLTIGSPACTGGADATNATNVCNNIEYKLYEVVSGSDTQKTAADNLNIAANGGKKTYKLVLTYKESNETSVLPTTNDVAVTGLGVSFTYTQDGGYVTPTP